MTLPGASKLKPPFIACSVLDPTTARLKGVWGTEASLAEPVGMREAAVGLTQVRWLAPEVPLVVSDSRDHDVNHRLAETKWGKVHEMLCGVHSVQDIGGTVGCSCIYHPEQKNASFMLRSIEYGGAIDPCGRHEIDSSRIA